MSDTMNDVSSSVRQSVFTIAPHAPFLPTLVDAILGQRFDGVNLSSAFGLSDILVIVPNARARLALADAFAERLGASLLPDIVSLGEDNTEASLFLPPFDAPDPVPAVSAMQRRLVLAQLVSARFAVLPDAPSAGEVFALADSLAQLIDDFHVEAVSPRILHQLADQELPAGFQQSLEFLKIALDVWPDILAELGKAEAAMLQHERVMRQAEMAKIIYGDRPVIAAGSTGSMPATSALLAAIARLPNGTVVLPGLDTDLSPAQLERLRDPAQNPHGHAQYGLARLIEVLGYDAHDVVELAPAPSMRTKIVRTALAHIADTGDWQAIKANMPEIALENALSDVSIAVANTQEEQARAIALAARQGLADGNNVGIISPDQTLARRIAAELARFDIIVDDSAGMPLFQSRAGRLARQLVAVALGDFNPVDVMALLRNRHVGLGLSRAVMSEQADWLELSILRGQRLKAGLAGLREALIANRAGENRYARLRLHQNQFEALEKLLTQLQSALKPLTDLVTRPTFTAPDLARALGATFDAIVVDGRGLASLIGADEFAGWVEALVGRDPLPPLIARHEMAEALAGLMRGHAVRAPGGAREDIAIWGLLEARLQSPDLMILAGLNEGVWPQTADPGPWMSRNMLMAAGLQPPERRQGQAAHDFEMAIGTKNTLIFAASRRAGSPATLSRLIQRLVGFVGKDISKAMRNRGEIWLTQARGLDAVTDISPALRPAPNPPMAMRPKALSITEVETLLHSPYEIYAKHVLKLKPLSPLGEDAERRDRGTLIHDVFDQYVREGHGFGGVGFDPVDAGKVLGNMADQALIAFDDSPARRARFKRRLESQIAEWIGFECDRDEDIAHRYSEVSGQWDFEVSGVQFSLRGRADRVDLFVSGGASILDFKTGQVPSPAKMREYRAPQLLLEAAMLKEGAFKDIPARETKELAFIKLGFGPKAFEEKKFALGKDMSLGDAVEAMTRLLFGTIETVLLSDTNPMSADVLPPETVRYHRPYTHLSRRQEWAGIDGGDDSE